LHARERRRSPVRAQAAGELIHEGLHLGHENCGCPALEIEGAAHAAYLLDEIQAYAVTGATMYFRSVPTDVSRKHLYDDSLAAMIAQYRAARDGPPSRSRCARSSSSGLLSGASGLDRGR
jgi:hypothetical protein